MPTNVSEFSGAGIQRIEWARLDSAGYMMGPTGTVANGADAGMTQLKGAKSYNLQPGQPRIVTQTGDDGPQAIFFFQPAELPNGDLVLGVANLAFDAAAQGISVVADGDYDVLVEGAQGITYRDLCLVVNSQAKSRESGSAGLSGFKVKIYPKVQAIPRGEANVQEAAATDFSHVLIANLYDTLPWGAALVSGTHGTTQGTAYGPYFAENLVSLHVFKGDGSTTTFTLDFTPAANSSAKVQLWIDGVLKTYTTHYTVAGTTVTLVAAPAAGAKVEVRYEHV